MSRSARAVQARHTAHHRRSSPAAPTNLGRCRGCGKFIFASRKDARRAARTLHPEEKGLNAYECPVTPGTWHYGHMPAWYRSTGEGWVRG